MADLTNTLDEAIRKTLGAVETVAPKAWEMLVRSERMAAEVAIMEDAFWLLISTLVGYALYRYVKAGEDGFKGVMDDSAPIRFFGCAGIGVCFVFFSIAVHSLPNDCLHLLHPDVFAARVIMTRAGL
jgi:hypothetical protein